jgi:hypothetical protein
MYMMNQANEMLPGSFFYAQHVDKCVDNMWGFCDLMLITPICRGQETAA